METLGSKSKDSFETAFVSGKYVHKIFLWALTMEHLHPCRLFVKNRNSFRSKSENKYKKATIFLSNLLFPEELPVDMYKAILTTLPKVFAKGPKISRSKSENFYSIIFLSERSCFPSSKSSGILECKFDCMPNECLSNLWKLVSQVRKQLWRKRY